MGGKARLRKLSSSKMYELTTSPKALPLYLTGHQAGGVGAVGTLESNSTTRTDDIEACFTGGSTQKPMHGDHGEERASLPHNSTFEEDAGDSSSTLQTEDPTQVSGDRPVSRQFSAPGLQQRRSGRFDGSGGSPGLQSGRRLRSTPTPLSLDETMSSRKGPDNDESIPSPMPSAGLTLPPRSLSNYLELELATDGHDSVYRSNASKKIYESSAIKIERLQNFLLLPPQLEQVLWFGALACLDAWLYSFTILPLRFLKALYILTRSWGKNIAKEIRFIGGFVFLGAGRFWHRRRRKSSSASTNNLSQSHNGLIQSEKLTSNGVLTSQISESSGVPEPRPPPTRRRRASAAHRRHRRTKSTPSELRPDHKADILKGFLIMFSCVILMYFDASRMYHGIRGQAAIKLYVIYNVLEVCCSLVESTHFTKFPTRSVIACSPRSVKMYSNVCSRKRRLSVSRMAAAKFSDLSGCSFWPFCIILCMPQHSSTKS